MTKRFFTLLISLMAMIATVKAQVLFSAEIFPDPKMREALIEQFWELKEYEQLENGEWRPIHEGEVIPESVLETLSLQFPKVGITNLAGIEYFTKLEFLFCYGNQLTSLDLSQNSTLKSLACGNNQLTSLDVSGCGELESLDCSDNQLTSLEVSNTSLVFLSCSGNPLTSLNLSGCTALTRFVLNDYQLNTLNLSGCVALTELYLNNCKVNHLNLSGCTALTEPELYRIQQLTTLNVSGCTAFTKLLCSNKKLASLDVSGCTALKELNCSFNQLDFLNVSSCIALTVLNCTHNKLTSLDVSNNTKLKELGCGWNNLNELDVSNNTELMALYCWSNQLTELDVSKNTILETLQCDNNQLNSLDVSKNTALTKLYCCENQLPSLDVSKNIKLNNLYCFDNQIKGKSMDTLVLGLPKASTGKYTFYVIDTKKEDEGNVCTKAQVAKAKEKGWTAYDGYGAQLWVDVSGMYHSYHTKNYEYEWLEYEGSDPVEEDIDPVDEDDNIDFGSDMDENDDLNGNVIGDIFYNIGNGNGEYNAEEGCIVLKKTTDDETVDGLSGKDIFGEDFKGQFTGIVFKVPSGKGTVKVTAETTGNMLLKVKIGDGEPVEMELNSKLKISFPYNVSETTLVAIYAGANNEAKGFGTTNATEDAALKIYGIEFIRDNTPTEINTVDSGELTVDSWYTIDGKKLAGEPKEKGIYIRNGRKVIK